MGRHLRILDNPLALEGAFAFICGALMYFCPSDVLQLFLHEEPDGVHWHMCRSSGSIVMGIGFTLWMWAGSTSKVLKTPHVAMSRTLLSILYVASCTLNETLVAQNATLQIIRYGSITVILYIGVRTVSHCLDDIVYFRSKAESPIIKWLRYDALFCVLYSLTWIASPTMILRRQVKITLAASHMLLSRFTLCLLFSTHVFSLKAIEFTSAKDRKIWILGRTLMCCAITMGQIYSLIMYTKWWTHWHFMGTSFFALWTLSAIWASFQRDRYRA